MLLRTLILPTAVSLAIIVILYSGTDLRSLWDGIRSADPAWLGVYALLGLVDPVLRGFRWHSLVGRGRVGQAVRAVFVGKAGNNLLPARIGDAMRIQMTRDLSGAPYRRVVASVLAETVLDLSVLAVLTLLLAFLAAGRANILQAGLAAAAILAAVFAVILHGGPSRLLLRSGRGPARAAGLILEHVARSIRERGARVLLTTGAIWVSALASSWSGLEAFLPGVTPVGVIASIVFVYFSVLIPSAPGFIGSYHAAVAGAVLLMGYGFEEHAALPLVLHLVQYVMQTSAGLFLGFGFIFGHDWRRVWADLSDARRRLLKGEDQA